VDPLENYRGLVARVDALCGRIETEFGEHLACRKGCDACCRHLSLFRVEGAALAEALMRCPAGVAARIRRRVRQSTVDGPCPLLEDGACLLYEARPIICRTHGLPLLIRLDGKQQVDCCPRNFRDVESLPAPAVIHLEVLNATLATINAHFVAAAFAGEPPRGERLTIAEALLLEPL
jgi:hypothetical protein